MENGSGENARKRNGRTRQTRRDRQADRVREDILEAASRAFTRAGYQAATMRAIAEEAGFSASSLYTYFRSKEEIFAALPTQLEEEALAIFEEPVPRGLGFSQRIELLFFKQMELVERRGDAFQFLFSAACGAAGSELASDLERHKSRYLEGLKKWLRANSSKTERAGHSIEDVAFYVVGALQGFFLQWLLGGRKKRLAERAPLISQLVMNGLS